MLSLYNPAACAASASESPVSIVAISLLLYARANIEATRSGSAVDCRPPGCETKAMTASVSTEAEIRFIA